MICIFKMAKTSGITFCDPTKISSMSKISQLVTDWFNTIKSTILNHITQNNHTRFNIFSLFGDFSFAALYSSFSSIWLVDNTTIKTSKQHQKQLRNLRKET